MALVIYAKLYVSLITYDFLAMGFDCGAKINSTETL
jgi:hypothetical protein